MDKLSPEEREIGRDNYYQAVMQYHDFGPGEDRGVTRRGFLQAATASAIAGTATLGATYFGYAKPSNPVRVGVIGTGDEGNVLIGAINPDYVDVVAIADIRPSSVHRAFYGDWASPAATAARPGLMKVYGWTEQQAKEHVQVYADYKELLQDSNIEAVIIALPLHLHAIATVQAVNAGKHVLTEKLMAHNVAQCKVMSREAEKNGKYLATGHQRHYSILYDNAVNLIRWGVLGEIHHIRAQWHRGNLPGRDSWAQPIPGGEKVWRSNTRIDRIASELAKFQRALEAESDVKSADVLRKKVAQWTAWDNDKTIDAESYGYINDPKILGNGEVRTAMEELVRWRVWDRTGGGLMAELGSHQLDASSIFVSALRKEKAHPLNVHAVGGRHIFPADRDADDHVYCMFEFPGPGYEPTFDAGYHDQRAQFPDASRGIEPYENDKNKKIVVTYSSINGNGFGGYGEIVMGTKGTLVLEKEKEVMLYTSSSTSTKVGIKNDAGGPTMDTQASGDGPAAKAVEDTGPISRGYKEEIEHWAWLIRNHDARDAEAQPRCKPEVALADAVIALTAKEAIRNSNAGKGGFIEFKDEWFDIRDDATPDGSSVEDEQSSLTETA